MLRIESVGRSHQHFSEEPATSAPRGLAASLHADLAPGVRDLTAAHAERANDRESAGPLGWLGTIFGGVLIGTVIGNPIGGGTRDGSHGVTVSDRPAMTSEDAHHERVRRDLKI